MAYTGGPWPYGYHGLGDVICFAFFGVVAVMGSGYVQSGALTWELAAASIPVGCLVTAILVANNLRDIDTDRSAGKRTLAVVLGERATRLEYVLLVVIAFGAILIFAATGVLPRWTAIALAAVALAAPLCRVVLAGTSGVALIAVLKRTAMLHLAVGVLLAIGAVIGGA